jgi:hypothetical protein
VSENLFSPVEQKRSVPIGQIVTGAVLIVVGVGWLLSALDIATIPWRALLAGVLIVIGIALAAAASQGHVPEGLVTAGIVLTIILALVSTASTALSVPLRGGFGDRNYSPTAATLETEYRLIAGQLVLDLDGVDFPQGETVVEASVTFGKLVVRGIPNNVAVLVTGRVTAGQVVLLGSTWDGVALDERAADDDFTQAGRRLVIDTAVGFGQIEVRR